MLTRVIVPLTHLIASSTTDAVTVHAERGKSIALLFTSTQDGVVPSSARITFIHTSGEVLLTRTIDGTGSSYITLDWSQCPVFVVIECTLGGARVQLKQVLSVSAVESLQISGNTLGASVPLQGSVILAGGNNITLSQDGQTISIMGGTAAGGGFNAGVSNLGHTVGDTGTVTNQLILAGGNNVTLSQVTGAGGATVTISVPNFGAAQTGISGISAGTEMVTSGTVRFIDSNGISFGLDGQSLTAIYTVPLAGVPPAVAVSNVGSANSVGTVTRYAHEDHVHAGVGSLGVSGGNTAGNTGTTLGQIVLQGGNNLTLSQLTGAGGVATIVFSGANTHAVQTGISAVIAGTTSISSGTLSFADSNGIAFGLDGQTLTASYTVPVVPPGAVAVSNVGTANSVGTVTRYAHEDHVHAGVGSLGVSGGNTAGDTGTTLGQVVLQGGNNVTLSQITGAGGSATIVVSAFNQTVQTQNLIDISLSGNTSGTLALISSGTAILAGGNNITLSQNGQSVTISAFNQTVQTQNLVDLSFAGNTSGTLALISSGTAILAGGNNITLSQNGQNVTISAANQTVQTQNLVDLSLAGNTSGTLALISSGTAILAGGNNITLSQDGQSITISAANSGTAPPIATAVKSVASANSVGTITRFAPEDHAHAGLIQAQISGNTSNTSNVIQGSLVLAGGNNVTLSQVSAAGAATITISAANQTVQTQNMVDISLSGNTSGTLTLISSGTAILAGGNNITLSQNGQSVTISAFNQTVQTQNCVDFSLAGNTTGTLALVSSGTVILAGGNNITLSQNGQSITISAANETQTAPPIATTVQSVGSANSVGTVTRFAAEDHVHGGLIQAKITGNTFGSTSNNTQFIQGSLVLSAAGGGISLAIVPGAGVGTVRLSVRTVPTPADGVEPVSPDGFGHIGTLTSQFALQDHVHQGVHELLPQGNFTRTVTSFFGGSSVTGSNQVLEGMLGDIYLNAGNNISFLVSKSVAPTFESSQSMTIQGPNMLSVGVSSIGNTAGTTGVVSNQMVLAGGNNITLSQATGTGGITITVDGGTVGGVPIATAVKSVASANSVGTITRYAAEDHAHAGIIQMQISGNTSNTSNILQGSLVLAGGNNITLSQVSAAGAATVTISAASPISVGISALGNTAGTTGLATNRVVLVGGNNITLSQSTNGGSATISISGPTLPSITTISEFAPFMVSSFITNSALGQNSIYVVPFLLPTPMYAQRINMFWSVATTVSGSGGASAGITHSLALYARDTAAPNRITSFWSGSLFLNLSASSNTRISVTHPAGILTTGGTTAFSSSSFQQQNATASNYLALSVRGFRAVQFPIVSTLTAGQYWLAIARSSVSQSGSVVINNSNLMMTLTQYPAYQNFGVQSTASNGGTIGVMEGLGVCSQNTGAFAGSLTIDGAAGADIVYTETPVIPYFNFSGWSTDGGVL